MKYSKSCIFYSKHRSTQMDLVLKVFLELGMYFLIETMIQIESYASPLMHSWALDYGSTLVSLRKYVLRSLWKSQDKLTPDPHSPPRQEEEGSTDVSSSNFKSKAWDISKVSSITLSMPPSFPPSTKALSVEPSSTKL